MSTFKDKRNAARREKISTVKLLSSTALTAAGLLIFSSAANAQIIDPNTVPTGANVISGGITIEQQGTNTDIYQNQEHGRINWNSFDHGSNAVTEFHQPSSDSWTVNKVVGNIGSARQTIIDGKIIANGNIGIIDQNGVLYGPNAVIDLNGAITTSGNLNESKFNESGIAEITQVGAGGGIEIMNGAQISVGSAGLAAFVAPTVVNNGVINAKMGNVVMAAGEKVTLDLYGDGLVEVAVDGKLGDALLENKGTINAQGGTVQITAKAAKQAVDNIINVSGVVDVSSVTQKGGKIILAGGDAGVVNVSGKLEASGQNGGGKVTVTGQNVAVENTTKINTNAGENGDGGDVFIYGNNFAIFSGEISARGGRYTGDGGDAEISAGQTVGYYGYTNLGAPNGETGTLLIDPTHLTISDSPFSADLAAIFTGTLFGNININDQALANTLASANVNLWASETLSTGSDIDLSTGKEQVGTVYGGILSGCFFGCPVYADTITDHNLTVAAPQVNLVHDIILGTGQLNVNDLPAGASVLGWGIINVPPGGIQVDELNLDGKIYKRTTVGGLANTLADDTQVNTTSNTINVLSDDALIQQAVQFADASDAEKETVNVAAGTYGESVKIDRSLALKGAKSGTPGVGRAGTDDSIETIVTGGSPGIIVSADDVTVDGFVLSGPTLTDGIVVDGWDRANIINNVVLNPRGHGILINNSENSQASFNKVDHTGPSGRKNGITVIGGVDTTVSDNEILNSSWDGIHVEGSSGTDILRNNISKSYQVGVVVMDSSSDTLIQDNTIYDSMRGIRVLLGSSDTTIKGNVIYNQSRDGIRVEGDNSLEVDSNYIGYVSKVPGAAGTVNNIKENGITILDSNGAVVKSNWITETIGDGIFLDPSDGSVIAGNNILNVDGDGIESYGNSHVTIGGSDDITGRNTINGTGGNGIRVEGGVDNTVLNNYITGTKEDGIHIISSDSANITQNEVLNPGGHGIFIEDSENSTASFNKVDHTGPKNRKNGITVIGGVDTTVSDNEILNSSWDGIHVEGSSGTDILRNNISKSYQVGVVVMDGSSDTLIQDNTIYDSMRGILIRNSSDATIIGSVIYNQSLDGVHIENNSDLIAVDNNEVYDSGAGIVVRSSDNIFILNNDLHDNKAYGLFAQGNSNDAIEVTGNTFTNNRVGARFESGIIDLTKISTDPGFGPYGNKFIAGANGQTGIEFDVGRGINEQLSLVRAGGGSTYDGNDFDTLAETDTPVTFGGTIGNQYFEGYNDPLVQQFVTLGDNAFVETGTDAAIWLDASNSTFNTAGFGAFTPAIDGIGGSQEAFLQSMFYHQPDADGRGIFWFGTVDGPDLIILDARKFFEEFAPYTGGVSGLNVTITGLPRLSGGTPAGSPGISGLNQIAPAAGDEETPPQQATVTDIEPSAGGNEQPVSQNASCWGDAVTAVGAGESVTYSYGGTFEESVAAAANCNTASLF